MQIIKTKDFTFKDLKVQWQTATLDNWLDHIKEQITILQIKNKQNPHPYYGTELILLARKLEIIGEEMGGTNSSWVDPKE